jgi:diadenosine tetraphosphatase ApaH/serine/threonine PP2A family protein phosphatase
LSSEKGRTGSFVVENSLVRLDPTGEALVIGDLHGNLESLKIILENSKFLAKLKKQPDACIVCLGDYVDRGPESAEILYVLLTLKLAFPNQVILLRGNHEGPKSLIAYPHDLPDQLQGRFPRLWQEIYEKMFELFDRLYLGVYVEDRYLMVHGGVSPKIRSLNDLAKTKVDREVFADVLWSDPDQNVTSVTASHRGVGVLFGEKVTKQVLSVIKAKLLIRGHQAYGEGYHLNHDGKVLTLFSRKGWPYFNNSGAYLVMPLQPKFETADELKAFIRQF